MNVLKKTSAPSNFRLIVCVNIYYSANRNAVRKQTKVLQSENFLQYCLLLLHFYEHNCTVTYLNYLCDVSCPN